MKKPRSISKPTIPTLTRIAKPTLVTVTGGQLPRIVIDAG